MGTLLEDRSLNTAVRKSLGNLSKKDAWVTYNSWIRSYEETFAGVLQGQHIIDFVKDKPEPVVVDLMASSQALADLFQQLPQEKKHGIAVSLTDQRKNFAKERDALLNIEQLSENLAYRGAWMRLEQKLDGKKADLIMARPDGGMASLPVHKDFFYFVLQNAWNMLSSDNGVLLTEIPSDYEFRQMGISFNEWLTTLKTAGLDVRQHKKENGDPKTRIMIVKKPDSPQEFPKMTSAE